MASVACFTCVRSHTTGGTEGTGGVPEDWHMGTVPRVHQIASGLKPGLVKNGINDGVYHVATCSRRSYAR